MYSFIKGKIDSINSTSIIVENNGIGYEIFTPNPYSFEIDNEYTV